ncbi:MAG: hypothetical protein AABX12_03930 [Nanoarchaeota archaeon]
MGDDGLLKKIGSLKGGSLILVNMRPSLGGAHLGVFKRRGLAGRVGNLSDSLVLQAPLYELQRLSLQDGMRSVGVPNLAFVYTSLEDATRGEYADWTMAAEQVRFLREGFNEIRDAFLEDGFYAPLAEYFKEGFAKLPKVL